MRRSSDHNSWILNSPGNGVPQPLASTLNAGDGAITSDMAIVGTTNGSINAFAFQPAQRILDTSGYFAP
jgi:hypothetical protein